MLRLVPYLAFGLISASAFAGGYLDPLANVARAPATFEARWSADVGPRTQTENNTRQDRLMAPRVAPSHAITTIELRGLNTAAIIYRDQKGRVLFQNDPASQTTTIAKGVVVPEVTIRNTTPISAPAPASNPTRRDAEREKTEALPDGCESAFSVVAAPSLANIPGRCVA